MLKFVGVLLAIGAIIGGIIAFRLYAHDRSLEEQRAEVAARCEGDGACRAAVEAHYEACHEELYDWHATSHGRRSDLDRRQDPIADGQSRAAVDPVDIFHCVRERAGLTAPVSP